MSEYVEVARVDEVPAGKSTLVKIGDKDVALFNVGGAIYALDDHCVHAGASLACGVLEGKVVKCRAHGWRYDVTTGYLTTVPDYGVSSYPTKIQDGKIFVAID